MKRDLLFVANWKMNMLERDARLFTEEFVKLFRPAHDGSRDVAIAPPFTALQTTKAGLDSQPVLMLGAQNVHWLVAGSHTGEISAPMLLEHHVELVIVGHSERRQLYGESDPNVAMRAKSALAAGMFAVVCVGESLRDFTAGRTADVIAEELNASLIGIEDDDTEKLVLAYEPIWAIGTGKSASPEFAGSIHAQIRADLRMLYPKNGQHIRIIYGGSTTPENITALIAEPEIDGALVGGASLKPDVFNALIENGRSARNVRPFDT